MICDGRGLPLVVWLLASQSTTLHGFVTSTVSRQSRLPLSSSRGWENINSNGGSNGYQDDDDEEEEEDDGLVLRVDPARADMALSFGTGYVEEEFEEEDQRSRTRQQRKARIAELLRQQDEEFRNERKREQWGEYANATTPDDIKAVEAQQKREIQKGKKRNKICALGTHSWLWF